MSVNNKNTTTEQSKYVDINDRIGLAVICRGLSQKELSARVGISQNAMVNYVKGRREPPVKTLLSICEICQVDAGWMISGEVNKAICNALLKSMERKHIPIELFAKKLEVAPDFFKSLMSFKIEPSLSFVKRYHDLFHDKLDRDLLLTVTGALVTEAVDFDSHADAVFDPKILEIVNLIYEDSAAQDIILEILHSRDRQKKLEQKFVSGHT